MDEKDWLMLKVLHEKRNITKTAEVLCLTQPALSRRLQLMEEEFKVKIAERGRKGIQFTSQGEYLASQADRALQEFRMIKEHLQNMETEVSGTLRIGASNLFTKYVLPDFLLEFKERYPKIEFKVHTGTSKMIYDMAYEKELHVAFVRGTYVWPSVKKLLFSEPFYVCSKEKIDFSTLPQMPCVEYENDSLIQLLIDRWWNEKYDVSPNISMSVNMLETAKEMAIRGLGYTFIPESAARFDSPMFLEPMIYQSGNPVMRETWMLYYDSVREMKAVQAFIDFINEKEW